MNRIKLMLKKGDKPRTQKWLAEQVGKTENTVSSWTKNKIQPSVDDLYRISELLGCKVHDLLVDNEELKN